MAIDPVCGMNVDPETAAGAFDYKGTKYYFCSKHCLESFQSHPDRYLAPKDGAVNSSHGSGHHATSMTHSGAPDSATPKPLGRRAQYTCPMHPEIVQTGPGSCPKCGMALVPLLSAAAISAEYTCPMHPEIVQRPAGQLPEVRHGARADGRGRGRRLRAARHDAPVLGERDPQRVPLVLLAMPPDFGIAKPFGISPQVRLARARARDAGGAVGRAAVLPQVLRCRSRTAARTCTR